MAVTYEAYLGKFAIAATNKDFTVDPGATTALALTTGDYYPYGHTGEATDQLLEHLQAVIRTVAAIDETTVTYDTTSGKVTMAFAAGGSPVSTDVTWDDAALGQLLGYNSSTLTSDDTYIADQPMRYVWRPTYPLSEFPVSTTAAQMLAERSTTRLVRAASGAVFNQVGDLLYDAAFRYSTLPEANTITLESSDQVWGSFRQFMIDVPHAGKPCRLLPDRDTYGAATDYVQGFVAALEGGVGSIADRIDRVKEQWQGGWDVEFEFWKDA